MQIASNNNNNNTFVVFNKYFNYTASNYGIIFNDDIFLNFLSSLSLCRQNRTTGKIDKTFVISLT